MFTKKKKSCLMGLNNINNFSLFIALTNQVKNNSIVSDNSHIRIHIISEPLRTTFDMVIFMVDNLGILLNTLEGKYHTFPSHMICRSYHERREYPPLMVGPTNHMRERNMYLWYFKYIL